jgi:hypothetical protein
MRSGEARGKRGGKTTSRKPDSGNPGTFSWTAPFLLAAKRKFYICLFFDEKGTIFKLLEKRTNGFNRQ